MTGLLTVLLVHLYLRKPAPGGPRLPKPSVVVQRGTQRASLDRRQAPTAEDARATAPGRETPAATRSTSAPVPCMPAKPGELKFSDDAANKHGAFWLEQPLEWTGAPAAHVLDLYLALDQQTQSGLRVRLSGNGLALELGGTAEEAPSPHPPPAAGRGQGEGRLAEAALAQPLSGFAVLGVLWLKGELSVWLGTQQLLQWKAEKSTQLLSGKPVVFGRPGAVHVFGAGLRLSSSRTLDLDSIRFDDSFMRNTADGVWSPLAGKWELTGMAFPERSANPFSLRTTFGGDQAVDDRLYQGRTRQHDYGMGIMISGMEGTLHVERITGGSPAARAGVAEDDIFLEVDGEPVERMNQMEVMGLLMARFGGDVRLRMLRPGEGQPREFHITREHYKWGTPAEGIPIQPVREPETMGSDQVALVTGGEAGWSNYAAEVAVKPLGNGGMGLAIGVLSPQDFLLFRWRGPAPRQSALGLEPAPTPLSKPDWRATPDVAGQARSPLTGRMPVLRTDADVLQLVRVSGGTETVLKELAAGYRPYEFYRLAMDWQGDAVTCAVDGNEVFSAKVPDLKRGQIALYALKGDPVFFDDVRVYSDRKALAAAHHPEQAVNQIFAGEEDMQVWANPAQEWDRDIQTGWAVHKARFPGEQAVVLNKPRFNELTMALNCTGDPAESYEGFTIKDGVASLGGVHLGPASAQVGRGPFQRIVVRGSQEQAEADVDGVHLSAPHIERRNGPVFDASDHIAIRGLKNLGDPNVVRVSSSNVLEYTFNAAPTDWKVACGRWGLLNKWICDPRWSWFGGRTKTLAALWNKFIFSGDITVDGYVALMMQQEDPPYERPGDYNLVICGDGANLDSGYTLVFGGDNNSWTRLYRKGKLAAESSQEAHRIFSDRIRHPDKPELHQRWFHVKLEKRGGTISFYRDDSLAFSFNDSEPLPEGRVAFWTVDNGFLLSRVRIAHGALRTAPFEPRRSDLFDDGRVINVFDGEVSTTVQRQALPAAIQAALAAPGNAFQAADADPLPADAKPSGAPAVPAYRVVNGTGGGPFAVQWKGLAIDPDARGTLRFAYCIEPGANVDLYLLSVPPDKALNPRKHGAYRWRLTGPRESSEFAALVGEVPNVQADGRWHAVQYDLNPSWRALWQQRGFKRPGGYALRPMIGNLANEGYLLAGMKGNHAGAAYSISDLIAFSPRETGLAAPRVQRVIWPYDPAGDGRAVALVFDDAGGSGIMDESLRPELNGLTVPRELMAFDHLKQTLRLDLAGFNLPPLTTLPKLNLKVPEFEDRARNRSAGQFSASYTFDPEKARQAAKPVAAPVVTVDLGGARDIVPSGTALTLAEATPLAPVARLQECADAPPWAPYGQKRSVQVVNITDGSAFGFAVNNVAYALRQWPYLLLEYRMPPETPANLHFYDQAGAMHALILGDIGDAQDPLSQEIASREGPPANFVCDGEWHSTVVPLLRCFADSIPQLGWATVRGVSLHDHGWRGNRRGMQYWVHRIQPLAAGRTGDFRFSWQATDITGISDYASCLDQNAGTDPLGKQELASGQALDAALAKRGTALKDGWNYLHVRVKNGAGVWSEPTHTRFMLDNTPPQVLRTEPPAGGTCAGQTIKIFLNEEHGVDEQALRLSINGQSLPGWQHLRFDAASNCLTYDAMAAGVDWREGGKVSVELNGLKDLLGNKAVAPFTFSFNAQKGAARPGPAIAQVRFNAPAYGELGNRQMAMELSFSLDFEEHTGHVRALRDCRMEWLDDPSQACSGRRAVRFTALDDDADVQIMLHKNPWYLDHAPLLQFDYKAAPGMRVDLLVEVLGRWLSIRFTGDGAAPEGGKAIGRIGAVLADGSWRHASVDLKSLIDAVWPNLPARIVNKAILSAQGREGCKRGSRLLLDNLELSRSHGAGGRFEWQAEASSDGIAGYSFGFDQAATTVPPEHIGVIGNSSGAGSRTGIWYAHIRACDQAGNWGPTRTMRVDFGE